MKNSNLHLVKVALWCVNCRAALLQDYIKSLCYKPLPFADKAVCSYCPDKQPTCFLDKAPDDLFSRPTGGKGALQGDEPEVMFQEGVDIVANS